MALQVDIVISAQDKTQAAFDSAKDRINGLRASVTGMASSITKSFLGIAAAYEALEVIKRVSESVYTNTVQFQGWEFTLRGAGLTSAQTNDELKFLNDTAVRLGLNVAAMGQSFSRFVLTGLASGMQLKELNADFNAVAEAMRIFHLPAQNATRAWIALTEVMSMGTLRSRQFNQQLSRDWPGIGALVAQAMFPGANSMKQFTEAMDKGQISSQRFMDAFQTVMQSPAMQAGLSGALNSIQASAGRLSTAWFNLTNQANNTQGLKEATSAINDLATTIGSPQTKASFDSLVNSLATLANWAVHAGTFTVGVINSLANAIGNLAVKAESLPTGSEGTSQDIERLKKQISDLQSQRAHSLVGNSAIIPYLDQQIKSAEMQLRALQFGQSHPELTPGASGTGAAPGYSLPALAQLSGSPSVTGAASKKSIFDQYTDSANKFSASLQKVNEIAQQSQTFMAKIAATGDKHGILGSADAMNALDEVTKKSKQYMDQVASNINSMVGETINGVVVTAKMAADAIDKLNKSQSDMTEFAKKAAHNIQDTMAQLFDSIGKRGTSLRSIMHDLFAAIARDASNALAAMIMNKAVGSMATSNTSWIAALGSMFGGSHAAGGIAQGGKISLVGERGPELFIPHTTGAVIPNNALRGLGGNTSVNIDARGAGPDEVAKLLAMRNDILTTAKGETEFRIQRGSWRSNRVAA